jgi:hypothetical protein
LTEEERDDEQEDQYRPPELILLGRLAELTRTQIGSITTGVQ